MLRLGHVMEAGLSAPVRKQDVGMVLRLGGAPDASVPGGETEEAAFLRRVVINFKWSF